MGTVDQVGDMLAQGMSGGEIGRKLGISRQRVSQISKRLGYNRGAPRKERKPRNQIDLKYEPRVQNCTPRVNVGDGALRTTTNSMAVGAISEFLVAADLMARGFLVYMPVLPSRRHDLIGLRGDDFITFEVRSGYRGKNNKLLFNKKASDTSAHYAVVVAGEPVIYEPPI